MPSFTVFLDRDNEIVLQLLNNGRPVNLGGLLRVTLEIGTTVIDSDTTAGAFDWGRDPDNGVLVMHLGDDFTETMAKTAAYLTLYDSVHPNGIVWETSCDTNNLYLSVCDKGA